jgi:hypothetical protein
MSTRNTNDPQHWRRRAAQMRALALKMGETEAAILMRDLAADYEKLAERAEIRTKGKSRDQTASCARRRRFQRAARLGVAGVINDTFVT